MNIDETPREPCSECGKLTKDRIVKRETICRECLTMEIPRIKNGDLRCCGNCKNWILDEGSFICDGDNKTFSCKPSEVCKDWNGDGHTWNERLIKT